MGLQNDNSDLSDVGELYVTLFYVVILISPGYILPLPVHHPEDVGEKKKDHRVCGKL